MLISYILEPDRKSRIYSSGRQRRGGTYTETLHIYVKKYAHEF